MKQAFFILLFLPIFSIAQSERVTLDSLLAEASSRKYENEDSNKVKLLCRISEEYGKFKLDSARVYANEGMKLSKKLDYKRGQGISFAALGRTGGNFDIKIGHYLKALKIFEQSGDRLNTAHMFCYVGGVYFDMGKYPQALKYFQKGNGLFEKIHNEEGVATSNHSIAAVYINLGDFATALDYESAALKWFESVNRLDKIAGVHANMGNCYVGLKQYNAALAHSAKAIAILESLSREGYSYASALSERGYIHFLIATDSTTILSPDSLLPAGRNANLEKALHYYTEAYKVYKKSLDFSPVDILARLSIVYAEMGRYKEALEYYRLHKQIQDSLFSQDIVLQVAEKEAKRQAELAEKQMEINAIQKEGKKKERIFFIVGALLLCLIILLIWRNYRKQRDDNAILAAEKEKLDMLTMSLQKTIVQKDELTAQLTLAADMKTRFLANISHELRTPVTLLTGMLEMLKNKSGVSSAWNGQNLKDSNTGDEERLEVAYNNSRKLQYMVEEILDLSRLEAKQAKPNLNARNISVLFKRMVYSFETYIEKEGLTLNYAEKDVQDVYISVDEYMLEKMVNNLVYNAVKFNEPGGWIKVNVLLSEDKEYVVFTINNSGSCVNEADLPHIFERFYQGDSTVAKAEGVGIGLSLVKEFAELMSGRVEVFSKKGAGTTFTLQFPVVPFEFKEEESPQEVIEEPAIHWEQLKERQTVLLVEDNKEMRYYLRQILMDKVNLAEAVNGKKALEWLAQNKADLIITDMMMPEMNGEELVSHLKNDDTHRNIPVITLTALADTGSKLNMLRLGIDDYIVKPFDASELQVRVYNLLTNLKERRIFERAPSEQDDIVPSSEEAEIFKEKIKTFVLDRLKIGDFSVYNLASELCMSERQLYRLSKTLTGCTPAQLVKEVRLQKAYELLLSGTISKIDNVAREVGFEDTNYFSRQFRSRFGKQVTDFF